MSLRNTLNSLTEYLPKGFVKIGENFYKRLPYRYRYGTSYRETMRLILESQHWNQEQLESYQLNQLKRLISHAIKNVPFYQKLYKGFDPRELSSVNDIHLLPYTSKDDLRLHREELRSQNYPLSAFQYHTTGGSTGKPVGLYWQTDKTVPMEKAFMKRQFGWIGHNMELDKSINIRGIPPSKGKRFEYINKRQLNLSSYHLTPDMLNYYIELINDFEPKALYAYPSTALILSRHLIDTKQSLPTIKFILCGSEHLLDWQRKTLQEAFNARIYSWYGQSEYVSLAGECEHSTEYHFYSEYGVTEILGKEGKACGPGETGEIVATGFLNEAFPLIRYRTEDFATLSSKETCSCHRAYKRAEKIDGRLQEMIVSKDKNLISMTAINMHDDVFDELWQFQFFQHIPGQITMKIVPKIEAQSLNVARITEALKQKLGNQFEITIEVVKAIEPTQRGKTTFLVQKIPIKNLIT